MADDDAVEAADEEDETAAQGVCQDTVEQVGGMCGALLTNLTAWLSGIWFDLDLVGGAFKKAAELLPFCHAVKVEQAVCAGQFGDIRPDLAWVIAYAAAAAVFAVALFLRQMKRQ